MSFEHKRFQIACLALVAGVTLAAPAAAAGGTDDDGLSQARQGEYTATRKLGRGLASVVFAVMVYNSGIPGADVIVATAVCTILLSVIAHGVTALPFIAILKARLPE